jgi:hypothetical protein
MERSEHLDPPDAEHRHHEEWTHVHASYTTVVWVVTVVHAMIHVLGWSFPFPTAIETTIWRARSLTLLFVMLIGGFVPVLPTRPWFDFTFNLLWI